MVSRAEQKERTRQAIVRAALRLSGKRGFAALSLREVARAAGIAPTSFYRHFQDMDALGLTLIDEVAVSLRRLMRRARREVRPDRSIVQTSVRVFMEFLKDHANLYRLFLGERSGSSQTFRTAIRREIARFVDELTDDLTREPRFTEKPRDYVRLLAEMMVTAVFHGGSAALDLPTSQRGEVAERIDLQLHIILAGGLAAR